MNITRWAVSSGMLLALCSVGMGQGLVDQLKGLKDPLTLAPKDLPDGYAAVKISLAGSYEDMLSSSMMMGMSGLAGSDPAISKALAMTELVWTKGVTLQVGSHRYLIVYKPQSSMSAMMMSSMGGS